MVEFFDDRHQAVADSYTHNRIAWLSVEDRPGADRMIVVLERDPTINSLEISETVVESRPVIHISGKIIDTDFQIYLVWPIPEMPTKSP